MVLICPRSLLNWYTCASIFPFYDVFIPMLFLFLTRNIFVTLAAPAYTKSFSSVIFPTLILFTTSSNFLVASNNLCFSIPLSGGNLSLVSFNSTLRIFSSMLMSSFVNCTLRFFTKTLLLCSSTFGTMLSSSTASHFIINTSCPSWSNQKSHLSSFFAFQPHFVISDILDVSLYFFFVLNPTAVFLSKFYSSNQPTFALLH